MKGEIRKVMAQIEIQNPLTFNNCSTLILCDPHQHKSKQTRPTLNRFQNNGTELFQDYGTELSPTSRGMRIRTAIKILKQQTKLNKLKNNVIHNFG